MWKKCHCTSKGLTVPASLSKKIICFPKSKGGYDCAISEQLGVSEIKERVRDLEQKMTLLDAIQETFSPEGVNIQGNQVGWRRCFAYWRRRRKSPSCRDKEELERIEEQQKKQEEQESSREKERGAAEYTKVDYTCEIRSSDYGKKQEEIKADRRNVLNPMRWIWRPGKIWCAGCANGENTEEISDFVSNLHFSC